MGCAGSHWGPIAERSSSQGLIWQMILCLPWDLRRPGGLEIGRVSKVSLFAGGLRNKLFLDAKRLTRSAAGDTLWGPPELYGRVWRESEFQGGWRWALRNSLWGCYWASTLPNVNKGSRALVRNIRQVSCMPLAPHRWLKNYHVQNAFCISGLLLNVLHKSMHPEHNCHPGFS